MAPLTTADRSTPGQLTLSEEHALLLQQISARCEDLLTAADAGRWPGRELASLLGYLRWELLRQAADEQWLLFPAIRRAADLSELYRGHARLQALVDRLAQLADDGEGGRAELAVLVRDIPADLEDHLAAEERLLGAAPATSSVGRRSHEWYPITEGSVVDVDALPADDWVDAVLERLLRLRLGEQLLLRSSRDPHVLWVRMDRVRPGSCGFVYLQDGPDLWRVQITRR
jgi:uncharacterized protein (DUF2249 family)